MEEQSNEALWYVVHTYSGYENKVANDLQTMVENRHLQDLICDIKVPVEMVPEIDKNGKQKMVEHKAHRCGIRIRRVCAWNTSKLAYGGSGPVARDTENYSMCTFKTGKRHECDLSASYNIGSRYFLREYEKSIPATEWRRISAKVPECAHRIPRTLNTLIRVCAELHSK
mgnify:FL=1